MAGLKIPFDQLSHEALHGVVEEFVTRDGTDYGEIEISHTLSTPGNDDGRSGMADTSGAYLSMERLYAISIISH